MTMGEIVSRAVSALSRPNAAPWLKANGAATRFELEFVFDRLGPCKLEQAYAILVPQRARSHSAATGAGPGKEVSMKTAAIYARVSSDQQREEHHDRESDGGAGGIREERRLRRAR